MFLGEYSSLRKRKNMTAKKPSLLERLTGTLEEEDQIQEEQSQPQEARSIKPKQDFEVEKDIETETTPIAQMAEEQDQWLPDSEGQLTIDVYQTPNDIVIKSTIAGVDPEDLDITITNDMVTIKGAREKDEEVSTENYYYQECYWGSFSRSIILPVDVEADAAEAGMKNGILTIKLPKIEKVKTRKIKVKSS